MSILGSANPLPDILLGACNLHILYMVLSNSALERAMKRIYMFCLGSAFQCLLIITFLVSQAQATPGYTIEDLGTLGGNRSEATALNDYGEVVGFSRTADGQTRGFYYQDGSMVDIGTLGGNISYARDINNNSQIVGSSYLEYEGGSRWHAFLYENNEMIDLGTLGGNTSAA